MRQMILDQHDLRGRHFDLVLNGKNIGQVRLLPDGLGIVVEDDNIYRQIRRDPSNLQFTVKEEKHAEIQRFRRG